MKIFTAMAYMSMVPYKLHEKVSCLFFHIAKIRLHVVQRNSGNLQDTGGVEIKAMGRERVEPIRSRKGEKGEEGRREKMSTKSIDGQRQKGAAVNGAPVQGSPHHCLAPRQLSTRKL